MDPPNPGLIQARGSYRPERHTGLVAAPASVLWDRSNIIAGAAYAAKRPHFFKKSRRSSETGSSLPSEDTLRILSSLFMTITPLNCIGA
jgi:hypothetical protein